MVSKLHLGPSFSLPLEAVTQTFAILAKRGVGKTYTASVMAEEMLKAGQQIVFIDPVGSCWGLRSGFPVCIFGGEHADVPLEESAGELIARALVENRFSAVLDLSLLRKGASMRFMTAFAETLYRVNREPLHLFVDEADAFAPQGRSGYGPDENKMLGAMEDIVRRGRKRGLGCTLITQRPSVLNKNVLTQCEVLVAMRVVHPLDIKAVMEWINVHGDPTIADRMVKSLPELPIGTAWFWSPGWGEFFERVNIRERETYDSSATPKPGEKQKQPKHLAEIDLNALGEQIKATMEKARADDPRALRKRIADLEKQLKERPTGATQVVEVEKRVEVPVLKNGQLDRTEKLMERTEGLANRLLGEVAELKRLVAPAFATGKVGWVPPKPPRWKRPSEAILDMSSSVGPLRRSTATLPRPSTNPSPINPSIPGSPTGGAKRMLIALAQRSPLTDRQLGVRAGLSSRSGTFGTYLGSLRSQGFISGSRSGFTITEAGTLALGEYDELPRGKELIDYWLSQLQGGAKRMFGVLVNEFAVPLTADEVGAKAEISATSGTFGTYLGKLRSLELVVGERSNLQANPELFEE
jgi:uncharacterized protein